MANLPTPVAFDLLTAFLDVTKATTGVALLLVSMVTVTCHVTSLSTVVAHMVTLLLWLLTVSRDVTSFATVVTGVLCPLTVLDHVSSYSTTITGEIFASAAAFAPSPGSSMWTILLPVASVATAITLVTTHHYHNNRV